MKSEAILTIIGIIFGCSGFWAFISAVVTTKTSNKSASNQMVMGIGHHIILEKCNEILARGYVTVDEYDNLVNYLYKPYKMLGGNGTAERMIDAVKQLPIKN